MKNADLPAMPITNMTLAAVLDLVGEESKGLTKREMFAMHAMQGLLSSASDDNGEWTNDGAENVAKEAVYFADALLEELEK